MPQSLHASKAGYWKLAAGSHAYMNLTCVLPKHMADATAIRYGHAACAHPLEELFLEHMHVS